MKRNKNIGSNFEDFLKEEGIQEEVEVSAIKSIIARCIKEHMKKNAITQTDMAKKLKTSRSGLVRLLDPENYSVTLLTLNRAASVIGKKVNINLVSDEKISKQ
ncbi:XRE family transcriptional regulator [Candidatus Dependentiae bacterium]|nr:XRE family transcriptional regulator [Candidatus Dependentiae bacterium]